MKRKIYLRNFGWFMAIWLILTVCFTLFLMNVEKNKVMKEVFSFTNLLSVEVERVINDFRDEDPLKHEITAENEITAELTRKIHALTAQQGYEAAIYNRDLELICSTSDNWVCQYMEEREDGTRFSRRAFLDPEKWFSEEQIQKIEGYLYAEHSPQRIGDLWHNTLEIKGFWLAGAEVIPDTITISKIHAKSFNEQGEVTFGSGKPITVYESKYVEYDNLPYYESGVITPNVITYPDGKIVLRSDERQVSLREAVLDKKALEKVIGADVNKYVQAPAIVTRTGFTYRFYTPYPYRNVFVQNDGSLTSEYWIVTANEFNILTGILPILLAVWVSSFMTFALTAWMLSTQTWKTIRSREELEQQRREMTNAIAHDLKTPLAIISGYAENLAEDVHTEKREHYITGIRENVQRCDRMIKDMLELSRLESGGIKLALETFSLREMTEEVLTKYRDVFAQKDIIFQIDGDCQIKADRQLMERVLENFFNNVVSYTPNGGSVEVRITGQSWRIANTGSQIPPEELEHIWRAYYKSDKSRRVDNSRSTGLGLSIVRSIFELHGFKYGAVNEENGACFWFQW